MSKVHKFKKLRRCRIFLLFCGNVLAEDPVVDELSYEEFSMDGEYAQEQLRTVYFAGLGLGMWAEPEGWDYPGEAFKNWVYENYGLGMWAEPE